jgi:hypothetical protein
MPSALLPRLLGHNWVQGQPTPLPLRSRAASPLAVRPPDLMAACDMLSYGAKGVLHTYCVPSAWSALLIRACSAPIRLLLLRAVLPRALDKNQSDSLVFLCTVDHADEQPDDETWSNEPRGTRTRGHHRPPPPVFLVSLLSFCGQVCAGGEEKETGRSVYPFSLAQSSFFPTSADPCS